MQKNKAPLLSSRKPSLPFFVFIIFGAVLSSILVTHINAKIATPPIGDVGILYATSQGSSSKQLWRMNLDGTGKTQLTNDQNFEHEWSRPNPDGKTILFMKAAKGSSLNFAFGSNELWLMDVNGGSQRAIIPFAKRNQYGWTGIAHAEWSPDSSKIVLVGTLPDLTSQIYVVDTNGNNPVQITKPVNIDGQNTQVTDPSWSSNNQIIFIRTWGCFGICSNQDVFKIDYASKVESRITNDPNWNFDPYMSPDGSTYLWLSFRSSPFLCPCDVIFGSTSGDLNPQALIADGGANANGTYSSDSKRILFLKVIGTKQVLHQINSDGSGLIPLAPSQAGESGIASFIPSMASDHVDNVSTGGGSGGVQSGGSSSSGGTTNGQPDQSSGGVQSGGSSSSGGAMNGQPGQSSGGGMNGSGSAKPSSGSLYEGGSSNLSAEDGSQVAVDQKQNIAWGTLTLLIIIIITAVIVGIKYLRRKNARRLT